MNKTSQIQLRVTPEQKALIKKKAQQANKDLSSWIIETILPTKAHIFLDLVKNLAKANENQESFCLAMISDFLLSLETYDLNRATDVPLPHSLTPLRANYLAAMVEHTAITKGATPPSWTNNIKPLSDPWFGTDLRSVRLYLLAASPLAFKRRNIFIDSTVGNRI